MHCKVFYMSVTLSSPLFYHLHPPSFCPCHCFVSVMAVTVLRGTGGISEKSEKSIQHETEGKHLMSLSNNSLVNDKPQSESLGCVWPLGLIMRLTHTHTCTNSLFFSMSRTTQCVKGRESYLVDFPFDIKLNKSVSFCLNCHKYNLSIFFPPAI